MKIFNKISVLITALFCVISLCACGSGRGAADGKIKVVCTSYPMYDWVKNIIGDCDSAEVSLLFENGVDIHSYQPSAEDIIRISGCDLLVYNGGVSDKPIEEILKKSADNTEGFSCMENLNGSILAEREDIAAEHEDHEEHDAVDEHIWLSLRRAEKICTALAEKLSELDAKNGDKYRENAEKYVEKLAALDDEYKKVCEAAPGKTLIFADRFPFLYLADDYGLECTAAFPGCSSETEASFDTVLKLAQKLKDTGVKYVLTTDNSDKKTAEAVISAAGVSDVGILEMNSMQAVSDRDIQAGAAYLSIMEDNLGVLKTALGAE
ncbi:MAG: metal ABC transporter substrate-binding protein [Clostridia bacterium]|nr:metal ABC transporter substrate-binding protein [Clostridia bacterium]